MQLRGSILTEGSEKGGRRSSIQCEGWATRWGLQRLSFLFDGEEVAWAFGLAGGGRACENRSPECLTELLC